MNVIKIKALSITTALLILAFASSAVASPATSNQAFNSQDLQKKIRKELVTLPYYGVFDNLAFRVNGSTVTLYGKVVRPTTRSDAERRVARLNGVTQVINRIEVLPLSPFDDSIRRNTYRALVRAGGLYRYFLGANPSIHIIVDRGHVTLEGVVDTRGDAQLAYITARGVPGSFSVTNNLRTERGRAY